MLSTHLNVFPSPNKVFSAAHTVVAPSAMNPASASRPAPVAVPALQAIAQVRQTFSAALTAPAVFLVYLGFASLPARALAQKLQAIVPVLQIFSAAPPAAVVAVVLQVSTKRLLV
jgi:hypothetical protein